MWNIESVKRDCQGNCGSPRNCTCEPAYAYRLVNAKQNYSEKTSPIWLTNRRSVWSESMGRAPDYGDKAVQPVDNKKIDKETLRESI